MSGSDFVSAAERKIVFASCLMYGALMWFWANTNGAIGIPRNDDAYYIRTAFHFA